MLFKHKASSDRQFSLIEKLIRKPLLFTAATALLAGLLSAGETQAASSVSWTSPPNNSSAPVGTLVMPEGIANVSGATGSGLDLVLVLDSSGSMGFSSPSGRVQTQRDAANALIASVPQASSRIGIVHFDSSATTVQSLQSATNQATLLASTTVSPGGGTQTDAGINLAASMLKADDNGASKQMVVISDGVPNSQTAAVQAATNANSGTVPVQVNTVGIPSTPFGNQQDIATAGGGTFVTATSPQALIDLFNGTAGNLVGISQIDVVLPDGTVLSDIGLTSGLGTFKVPQNYALKLGANTWKVTAFFDDNTSKSANLTVFGTAVGTNVVPLPAAGWLLLAGLGGLGALRRFRKT
ncbi:hypothetical protein SuNHUV7_32990 (plasmid) [Pseudoseohaeicola sp. NH-UV-7]|uniref:vWA domain-containing protein n=1 Tax=Sulfitobacter sp. TBRI5 TaxID=2989732 RepID=UPI003A797932